MKDEDGVLNFSTADHLKFMNKWKAENYDKLVFELDASGDNYQFLKDIMFATSASKNPVPLLQNVIQADAAHMNLGKYTLYSMYGNMTNANMTPVAFAVIFGNEDHAGWTKFWDFAVQIHPSLNSSEITIITDQDKGQIAAIAECMPNAFHFHCTVHCQQNISKKFLLKTRISSYLVDGCLIFSPIVKCILIC